MDDVASGHEIGGSELNPGGPAARAWDELLDVLRDAPRSFLDRRRGRFDELEVADGFRNLTSTSRSPHTAARADRASTSGSTAT